MRLFKYLIYAVAAIAIPLWLLLGEVSKKDNTCNEVVLKIDTNAINLLDKLIALRQQPPNISPAHPKPGSVSAPKVRPTSSNREAKGITPLILQITKQDRYGSVVIDASGWAMGDTNKIILKNNHDNIIRIYSVKSEFELHGLIENIRYKFLDSNRVINPNAEDTFRVIRKSNLPSISYLQVQFLKNRNLKNLDFIWGDFNLLNMDTSGQIAKEIPVILTHNRK
jgi:hypothetical protein